MQLYFLQLNEKSEGERPRTAKDSTRLREGEKLERRTITLSYVV